MKKTITLILLHISFLFVSCGDESENRHSTVVSAEGQDTLKIQSIEPTVANENAPQIAEEEQEPSKLEEKIVEEAIDVAVDLTKLMVRKLRVNDSIRMSNREKMFAYQIGFPLNNKEETFEVFKGIKDSIGLFVLKVSRKDYYVVKFDGSSKEELESGLDNYNKTLSPDIGRAKVINLASLCSRREKLMRGENLTKRKEEIELPCLICDK